MKASLSFFQAFRLVSKRMSSLAATLALLFSLCALGQYLYVKRELRAATVAELESIVLPKNWTGGLDGE